MSRKEIFTSRGLDKQGVENIGRSFELHNGDVCTVDRELDRLFQEFWEGADYSKSLSSQRKRRKLSADAGCKAIVDRLDENGRSMTEDSSGPE
jgi:hypothetical protein